PDISSAIHSILDANMGNQSNVSLVVSFNSATVDIGGGTQLTTTGGGDVKIAATVDGHINSSATNNSSFNIAVTVGSADPEVLIHGSSQITAAGKLDATATSNLNMLKTEVTGQPSGGGD